MNHLAKNIFIITIMLIVNILNAAQENIDKPEITTLKKIGIKWSAYYCGLLTGIYISQVIYNLISNEDDSTSMCFLKPVASTIIGIGSGVVLLQIAADKYITHYYRGNNNQQHAQPLLFTQEPQNKIE